VIDVRVRDDDAADVFERPAARAECGAQRIERRRVFGSRVDQRQLIALGEIDVDRTDRKRGWNRDGLQIVENGTPLDAVDSACYTFDVKSYTGGK